MLFGQTHEYYCQPMAIQLYLEKTTSLDVLHAPLVRQYFMAIKETLKPIKSFHKNLKNRCYALKARKRIPTMQVED